MALSRMKGIAFYTTKPFWAGDPLDLKDRDTVKNFIALMEEIVFSYNYESFELDVCKDGMLILHVRDLELEAPPINTTDMSIIVRWWSNYLDYANCLNLLLDSSVLEVTKRAIMDISEITNQEAIRVTPKSMTFGNEVSLFFHFGMARFAATFKAQTPDYAALFRNRLSLSEEIFELTANRFAKIASDQNIVRGLSFLAKSIAEYKVGNYYASIILSWFVIESASVLKWENFIQGKNQEYEDGLKRINYKREERLKGRDYPIAVVINMLEISDILPFHLFRDIDTVRDYRNKVVHLEPTYRCEPEHCKLAINTAIELALEKQPFRITPNLDYSIRGA